MSRSVQPVWADAWRDRFEGRRAFVIVDAPSLWDTPLHLLAHASTIVVEGAERHLDRVGWTGSFHVSLGADEAPCPDAAGARPPAVRFVVDGSAGVGTDGVESFSLSEIDGDGKGVTTGPSIGVSLGFHMGFQTVVVVGTDAMSDRAAEELRWLAGTVALTGRVVRDASVGPRLDGLEAADLRRMMARRSRPPGREVIDVPMPGEALGVPVKWRDHVPPVALAAAAAGADGGLVVDFGAGLGEATALLAESGAEVRSFEAHTLSREQLIASCDPAWSTFVDARAIGLVPGVADVFLASNGVGATIEPSAVAPTSRAAVATSAEALEQLCGRVPDLVRVAPPEAAMEILRGYPWPDAAPSAVVVEANDAVTPRFGFRSLDIGRVLIRQGYEVAAVRHERLSPMRSAQCVTALDSGDGVITQVVGVRSDIADVAESMELGRRAVLLGRRDSAARATMQRRMHAGAEPAGGSSAPSQQSAAAAPPELSTTEQRVIRAGGPRFRQRVLGMVRAARRRVREVLR